MIIKTYIEPPLDNNNYLLIDEKSHEAALIDCSAADENIEKDLKENGAVLKYILLTHGHFDHITGLRPNTGAKIFMHLDDFGWVRKVNQYLPAFNIPEMPVPQIDEFIDENSIIKLGKTEIKVIHTPGHTKGGVCYYTDGKLFSGDTIFREAVGRCDLEGGDFDTLYKSIKSKIYTLPPETTIYPGHGKISSVEWEIDNNAFV